MYWAKLSLLSSEILEWAYSSSKNMNCSSAEYCEIGGVGFLDDDTAVPSKSNGGCDLTQSLRHTKLMHLLSI